MRVWAMRTGITISLTPADQAHLKAVVSDRNTPQKHVWRAQIVLLSASGAGTRDQAHHRQSQDLRLALAGTCQRQ